MANQVRDPASAHTLNPTRAAALVVAAALALGCGGGGGGEAEPDAGIEGGPVQPFPELYCPGSPGCTGEGDGVLRVGAARADINPDFDAKDTEWEDLNDNSHYDSGEPFTDSTGTGKFDGIWIAGFGNGRPATGMNDDLWVRAIAFEWNDIRVAVAVIDCVGWFSNEIEATRELLPASLELDHVIVASTHVHQAVDTIGLWGRQALDSGLDPDYQALVRERTAEAITAAVGALEPVTMSVAQTETVDEDGDTRRYVNDVRDPIVIDPTVTVIQFSSVDRPGETVATMVHWAAHPEYAGSRNNLLSADFVYWLREGIEHGVAESEARGLPALEGLGGEVVFLNGALGGQIGPSGVRPLDDDGEEVTSAGLPKAEWVGKGVARLALEAITSAEAVTDAVAPSLELRTGRLNVVVENVFYHVAGLVGVFDRPLYGYDETKPISPTNLPYIEARITYLRVGPVGIITAPGELHPELFVGGYDGSRSYGRDIVQADNPNPPLLDRAPPPPYLRDVVLDQDGVEFAVLFGLAEDFIGYIVPAFNYELHPENPYIERALGHHYEETNSVGPLVEEQVVHPMRDLVTWRPE
jgi:hypothetical protein